MLAGLLIHDIIFKKKTKDEQIWLHKIVQLYNEKNPGWIILDFTNVTDITSGLAKELFGGLYQAFGTSMKDVFGIRIGKDNDILKATILRALSIVITKK